MKKAQAIKEFKKCSIEDEEDDSGGEKRTKKKKKRKKGQNNRCVLYRTFLSKSVSIAVGQKRKKMNGDKSLMILFFLVERWGVSSLVGIGILLVLP